MGSLSQQFESSFALIAYLRELSFEIQRIYKNAPSEVGAFARGPEAQDLAPYHRRARIESVAAEIAERHPAVEVSPEPNVSGNCWHREIKSGKFLFTLSAIADPIAMVREAEFRNTLVESAQLTFESILPPVPRGDHFYGILRYGHAREDHTQLAFLRLGFPSKESSYYVLDLDLFKRFEMSASMKSRVEKVPDRAIPVLKRITKKESG